MKELVPLLRAAADKLGEMESENGLLRKRVEVLEKIVEDLRAKVGGAPVVVGSYTEASG